VSLIRVVVVPALLRAGAGRGQHIPAVLPHPPVALAAGTGVLRAPFGGDEPRPGASVSASVTHPESPLVSPSPSDAVQGGSTPGKTPPQGDDEQREDAAPAPDEQKDRGGHRSEITAACRDLREGKRPDADRRRALRDAAGDRRVWQYCRDVLSSAGSRSKERRNDDHADQGHHQGKGADPNRQQDRTQDRKQDRKQDEAERKAVKQTEKQAEKRSGKGGHDRD
jgi:hypothetical protein